MEALGDLKIILIFANGIMHWTYTIVALSKTVLVIMNNQNYHGHEKSEKIKTENKCFQNRIFQNDTSSKKIFY